MIVYIGAISVLILFAIMLTQTKDAPARLVFQTQAGAGGHRRRSSSPCSSPWPSAPPTGAASAERVRIATDAMSTVLFEDFVFPFEIVSVLLLAAVIGGVYPRQARTGRAVVSNCLDAYLVLSGHAVRHRLVRLPGPAQRDQHAHVHRADAQRGQPRRSWRSARSSPSLGAQASVIALMVMAVAAAEATVGLAIVIAIYRNKKTPLVDEYDAMRQ